MNFPMLTKPSLVALLGLVPLISASQSGIWSGNGNFYEVIEAPNGISWANANLEANSRGGHLATLVSQEENEFVAGLADHSQFWTAGAFGEGVGPWIGGFQNLSSPEYSEPAGGFEWVTGEAWDYSNFAPGEPNNSNFGEPEGFLSFWAQSGGHGSQWNDLPNEPTGLSVHSYVVEIEAVPEPVSGVTLLLACGFFARGRRQCSRQR